MEGSLLEAIADSAKGFFYLPGAEGLFHPMSGISFVKTAESTKVAKDEYRPVHDLGELTQLITLNGGTLLGEETVGSSSHLYMPAIKVRSCTPKNAPAEINGGNFFYYDEDFGVFRQSVFNFAKGMFVEMPGFTLGPRDLAVRSRIGVIKDEGVHVKCGYGITDDSGKVYPQYLEFVFRVGGRERNSRLKESDVLPLHIKTDFAFLLVDRAIKSGNRVTTAINEYANFNAGDLDGIANRYVMYKKLCAEMERQKVSAVIVGQPSGDSKTVLMPYIPVMYCGPKA